MENIKKLTQNGDFNLFAVDGTPNSNYLLMNYFVYLIDKNLTIIYYDNLLHGAKKLQFLSGCNF